jgi:hypothetical protein
MQPQLRPTSNLHGCLSYIDLNMVRAIKHKPVPVVPNVQLLRSVQDVSDK